jgi:crotonobetainyl-CoA:carnitine CoA-transferase CaiB-like acyl-CoA transferase
LTLKKSQTPAKKRRATCIGRKLKKTITTADVVLVNFKSGDAEKLGLDYESVKQMQPQIIYGLISGFWRL